MLASQKLVKGPDSKRVIMKLAKNDGIKEWSVKGIPCVDPDKMIE